MQCAFADPTFVSGRRSYWLRSRMQFDLWAAWNASKGAGRGTSGSTDASARTPSATSFPLGNPMAYGPSLNNTYQSFVGAAANLGQQYPQRSDANSMNGQGFGLPQHPMNMSAASFASALGPGGCGSSGAQCAGNGNPMSAFAMLGKNMPPGMNVPTSQNRQSPEQLIANALNHALAGERKSIPIWNGSPSTLRPWLKLLSLWEYECNLPMEKRGIKLLQSFPESSQPRRIADCVPTDVLLQTKGTVQSFKLYFRSMPHIWKLLHHNRLTSSCLKGFGNGMKLLQPSSQQRLYHFKKCNNS